jgi:hypothetical protein
MAEQDTDFKLQDTLDFKVLDIRLIRTAIHELPVHVEFNTESCILISLYFGFIWN